MTSDSADYDEPIADRNHPKYDWVDDPTLTGPELLARFEALGPTENVATREEWEARKRGGPSLSDLLIEVGLDPLLAPIIREKAELGEVLGAEDAKRLLDAVRRARTSG